MEDAAKGIESFMCVSEEEMSRGRLEELDGIRNEFIAHGSEEDKLCMAYVLDGVARRSLLPTGVGQRRFDDGL